MANAFGRALKVALGMETADFLRGIGKATDGMGRFGKYVRRFARAGALAWAGITAAVGKYATESIKAFSDDEAGQVKLRKAMKNTIGATDQLVKSAEGWIRAQQLAYGISDEKLRPAFQKLLTVTKDYNQAQRLTSLAMDLSAGTGKDLETVSLALAKAADGNLGALKRLGISLDETTVKNKDFEAAVQELSATFGGQATAAADTYAGKVARLKEAWADTQEEFGKVFVGPGARLVDWIRKSALPAVNDLVAGFTGSAPDLGKSASRVADEFAGPRGWYSIGDAIRNVTAAFGNLFGTVTKSKSDNTKTRINNIADALNNVANGINAISRAWDGAVKWRYSDWGKIMLGDPQKWQQGVDNLNNPKTRSVDRGPTVVINGVVGGEDTRRMIEKVLQDSSRRTTPVNVNGNLL